MADRQYELKQFQSLLESEVGQQFVDELRTIWDQYNLLGDTPEKTAYNVGLRDAFKFIEDLQHGVLIDHERE